MLRYLIILLCLACTSSYSLEENDFLLALTEGDISATVHDSVNVLTGDFVITPNDIIVKGKEPIHLPRSYFSRRGNDYFSGWQFNSHLRAIFEYEKFLTLYEKSGAKLTYVHTPNWDPKNKKPQEFNLEEGLFRSGITNCPNGQIGSRYNLRNNKVEMDHKFKRITVYEASGGKRLYKQIPERNQYQLEWEEHPNGNHTEYQYNKKGKLKFIQTMNPSKTQIYATLKVDYIDAPKHFHGIKFTTSDGQSFSYNCEKYQIPNKDPKAKPKSVYLFNSFESPNKPTEKIHYLPNKKINGRLIETREFPNGKLLLAGYYLGAKKNNVAGSPIELTGKKDPRYHRVKTLCSTINSQTPELLYKFLYNINEDGSGSTEVYNALNNLTTYHYNENLRMEAIHYHESINERQALTHTEKYSWGKENSPYATYLLSKTFSDHNDNPILATRFYYDTHGNITKQTLFGNLTGASTKPIQLDQNNVPQENGCETYTTSKTYSKDGRNLLLEEKEQSGLTVQHTYHPKYELLLSTLLLENQKILLRTFYEYNDDNILIREITDDGSTPKKNNLQGITERHIKQITPRKSQPFYGLPEVIEEKYLDIKTNQEKLLKKVLHHYHPQTGHIIKSDIYDRNNTYQYSITLEYDHKNRLIRVEDPLNRIATTTYDENNNILTQKDPNDAYYLQNTYDFSSRLIASTKKLPSQKHHTTHFEYNNLSEQTGVTTPQGNQTTIKRNSQGYPTTITKPNQTITHQKYDLLGNIIEETDPEGNITRTTYNARSKPTKITHPDHTEETFTYNLDGTLKLAIDPAKTQTKYTYDALGRQTSKEILSPEGETLAKETFEYNTFQLLKMTDATGTITNLTYDSAGRKIQETITHNNTIYQTTTFDYDTLGRHYKTTKHIDPENAQIHIQKFDPLNRIIEEREEDQNQTLYSITRYEYDKNSNKTAILTETNAGISRETYKYDALKRQTQHQDPSKNTTLTEYNDFYQNKQTQIIQTDPQGTKTLTTYDPSGNITEFTIPNIRKDTFTYNKNNQKITHQIECQDFPTRTHNWTYNKQRKLKTQTENGRTTHYFYSETGDLTKLQTPNGITHYYTHDPLKRLLTHNTSDHTIDYQLTYNKRNQIKTAHSNITNKTTIRNYNPIGDLIEEKQATNHSLEYQYDQIGRKTKCILPNNHPITYTYDPYHLKTITYKTYAHKYTHYDKSHQVIQEELISNLGTLTHKVDKHKRRIATTSPYNYEKILEFDKNNNITKTTTQNYTYNTLNQITQEEGTFNHTYNHDPLQNRLEKDQIDYQINTQNELTSTTNATFTHDENGNRTSKNQTEYQYDALNRLIQVDLPGYHITYTYDYFNRRLTKTVNGNTSTYLYDNQNEIGLINPQNKLQELRILGQGIGAEIGATILIELQGATYAPLHDLFGNITGLIDTRQNLIENYSYNPFGEIQTNTTQKNPWKYQSKRHDPETQLVNFGRRYYDPEIGRFLTHDPKGLDEHPNPYQFLLNNPLISYDLYGLSAIDYETLKTQMSIDTNFEMKTGPPYSSNYDLQMFEQEKFAYNTQFPELPNKQINFVNGMGNDFNEAKYHANYLSNMSKSNIHFTHNATHGIKNDLIESRKGLNFELTEPAIQLTRTWYQFFEKNPSPARILQISTSQGCIHTLNALLCMPKELQQRIIVLAIAPAAYISNETCYRAYNYESTRDFVPMLQRVVGPGYDPDIEVTRLKPHPDAPLHDHSIQSPTFRDTIWDHIRLYSTGFYD